MLYLPDVAVVRTEDRPGSFIDKSGAIIRRRSRTLLQVTRSVLAGGSGRPGAFIRIRLIERTVTAALPLIGLLAACGFAVLEAVALAWAYLLWILTFRLLQTLILLCARPRVHGLWPLLIEYDRSLTALVLVRNLVRPDQHRRVKGAPPAGLSRTPERSGSRAIGAAILQGLVLGVLVIAVALLGHLLDLPPFARSAPGL